MIQNDHDLIQIPCLDPYEILYNGLLNSLENYPRIEKQILHGIISLILNHLVKRNIKNIGTLLFETKNTILHFEYQTLQLQRQLDLGLIPLHADDKDRYTTEIIDVNMIGMIRTIRITLHHSISDDINNISCAVSRFIKTAYASLERLLVEKISSINNDLFNKIYTIFEWEMSRLGKNEDWTKKCFFAVTDSKKMYNIEFCENRIRNLVEIYKQNQMELYSPLELLLCLMREKGDDTFIATGCLSKQESLIIPMDETLSRENNYKLWISQEAYFKDENLAVRELCRCKGYILELCSEAKICEELDLLLDSSKTTTQKIDDQFMANITKYEKYRDAVLKITDKIINDENIKRSIFSYSAQKISGIITNTINTLYKVQSKKTKKRPPSQRRR
jgi:hypothetical protein